MDLHAAARATLSPGRHMAGYEVLGEVARGGMGVVYKVRDEDLERTLAMKVLAADRPAGGNSGSSSKTAHERFWEEAKLTAQLDHPGIIPVHACGCDDDGRYYFTMKLVEGTELGAVIELAHRHAEGWSLARLVGVLVQVCQAVAYAHSKAVLHRDLKPANVMIGAYGEVYVMDWGLARHRERSGHDPVGTAAVATSSSATVSSSPSTTQDGSVIGTPAYISPEQATGRLDEVDDRSDVYSLGAILYHLLAGAAPYLDRAQSNSPREILQQVIQGPPTPVQQLQPKTPLPLVAVCNMAMARKQDDRYPSAREMAADLQAYLDGRVVRAHRTGAWAELKAWVSRNRLAALAGTLTLLAVVTFSVIYGLREQQHSHQLRERLALNNLRRGQLFCEEGDLARGLHWLARSLMDAPEQNAELSDVIRQNMGAWGRAGNLPRAYLSHRASARWVDYSSDGKRLVSGSYDSTARLWSAETGLPIGQPMRHKKEVNVVLFSPDGTMVLTASDDHTARLWFSSTAKPLAPPLQHNDEVLAAAFSPDGNLVLTGGLDKAARLWHAETGEPVGAPILHKDSVRVVQFGPDGSRFLTAGADGQTRLWSTQSLEPIGQPMAHQGGVWSATFSPDGTRVLTGGEDATARFWSAEDGRPLGAPLVHRGPVRSVAFSPDGQRVVTGSDDDTARIWSVEAGKPLGVEMQHGQDVLVVAFTPDGQRIVSGSRNNAASFWSAETGEPLKVELPHEGWVWSLAFSPDGKQLLTGADDYAAKLWSIDFQDAARLTLKAEYVVWSAAFCPDGQRIVTGGAAGGRGSATATIWSARTGEVVGTIDAPSALWSVQFSPNGGQVLTCGRDGTARLWSAESGMAAAEPIVHGAQIRCAAFNTDGTLLATGGFDNMARVWNLKTGELVHLLEHPQYVEDVAFSPNEPFILTACGDGQARVWSLESGQSTRRVFAHNSGILGVAFSPDGRTLATGSTDKSARLWDFATGEPIGYVLEHPTWIEDVAFSPDGKWLVTSDAFDAARLWSLDAGEQLGPPMRHEGPVNEVSFSPDGQKILTAGGDGVAKVWQIGMPYQRNAASAPSWAEAMTGIHMDEHGTLGLLTPEEWLLRRGAVALP